MNKTSDIINALFSTKTTTTTTMLQDLTLNELLDKLGFDKWKTITASFVLPVVNLLGA